MDEELPIYTESTLINYIQGSGGAIGFTISRNGSDNNGSNGDGGNNGNGSNEITNEETYYYQRNLLGDVTHIYDSNGSLKARYIYDAWGNHKVLDHNGIENNNKEFIGNVNPIRYRGYYFDSETRLYYLQTIYYDPSTGRFINADSIDYADPESINGLNLYVYCNSNPIMRHDPSGTAWWNPLDWIDSAVDWVSDNKQLVLTALVIVAVVGLTIATAGSFGFVGSMIIGAALGALSGAAIDIISQGFTNGFDNINWGSVGMAAAVGGVLGGIGGGLGGGIKYARSFKALRASNYSKAEAKAEMAKFKGIPALKTKKAGTETFRVHGGKSKPIGKWVSPKEYKNPVNALSLDSEWNNATRLSKLVINKDVKVLVGRAAPIRSAGLSGGGKQWFLFNDDYDEVLKILKTVLR